MLDLLPDREAAPFAKWLEQHDGPHVEVVSRARGGAFADGARQAARQAAPQAVHVADRFPLLQDWGQAVDQLLTHEHRVLTQVADAVSAVPEPTVEEPTPGPEVVPAPTPDPPETPKTSKAPTTRLEREHAAVEARRQACYERVVALASDG